MRQAAVTRVAPRAKRWKRWVGYNLAFAGVYRAVMAVSGAALQQSPGVFLRVGVAAALLGWGVYWIRGNRKAEDSVYTLNPYPPMRFRALGWAMVFFLTAGLLAGCAATGTWVRADATTYPEDRWECLRASSYARQTVISAVPVYVSGIPVGGG